MIVSHKNTNTIGDFANTWPFISQLAKAAGPIEITLPPVYTKFVGLREFLEYQVFVKSVDFDDRDSHVDVQAHANWSSSTEPRRCYYTADQFQIPIDRALTLRVEDIDIPDKVVNKTIVIDRTRNNILSHTNWFKSEDYYWLDFSKPLSYNINVCLKASRVIATFTGLPVILDLFHKEFDLIWFDDINGPLSYREHFFSERNSKLIYYKDYQHIQHTAK